MKHLLYILILNLIPVAIFSQNSDREKLKFGGWFGMEYNRYDPKTAHFQYFYDESVDSTLYCCQRNKIEKYADPILSKSEQYITQRSGRDFFNSLKFQSFVVIYHDYYKIANFDSIRYDIEKCGRINYWLTYSYFRDSISEYGFGIEFDSKGKRITEHKIPNKSKNQDYLNLIPYSEALKIARLNSDFKTKPIESVKLEYNHSTNSFCWLITEDYEPQVMREIGENEFEVIGDVFEIELLYINAQTGGIVKKEFEKGRID